jgi:16S rRNA (cytosine1402-N4)-methyltransferase
MPNSTIDIMTNMNLLQKKSMNRTIGNFHTPVLAQQAVDNLITKEDGIYVDCTAGFGGHSSLILEKLNKNGRLICVDVDQTAIDYLNNLLGKDNKVNIVKDNFANLKDILNHIGLTSVDGILMDLGVSSVMFDDPERGFSYNAHAHLDMRMDQTQTIDAAYIINNYDERQLINIFRNYGEIANPKNVVRAILNQRKQKRIQFTDELVAIIKANIPTKDCFKKKHPARTYFQALRIEVNKELFSLKKIMDDIPLLLKPHGRIAVISFHSLEDRIVKQAFNKLISSKIPKEVPIKDEPKEYKLINRKPIIADEQEITLNHRARSAKLRVLERL